MADDKTDPKDSTKSTPKDWAAVNEIIFERQRLDRVEQIAAQRAANAKNVIGPTGGTIGMVQDEFDSTPFEETFPGRELPPLHEEIGYTHGTDILPSIPSKMTNAELNETVWEFHRAKSQGSVGELAKRYGRSFEEMFDALVKPLDWWDKYAPEGRELTSPMRTAFGERQLAFGDAAGIVPGDPEATRNVKLIFQAEQQAAAELLGQPKPGPQTHLELDLFKPSLRETRSLENSDSNSVRRLPGLDSIIRDLKLDDPHNKPKRTIDPTDFGSLS